LSFPHLHVNFSNMSTVAEIKAATDRLSPQERCELEALLHPQVHDDWDRQMAADTDPGGKLCQLKEDSIKNAKAGRLTDFPPLDAK
jgi:hypothetical protein